MKHLADKYFSLAVRYRDSDLINGVYAGNCITCDKLVPVKQAHAGHFISRRHNITRWDEENVNLQCAGCNLYGAGEQYKYGIALDKKYGDGTAKKLSSLSRKEFKLTREFLEDVIHDSKEEVKFYEHQKETPSIC